MKKRIGFVGIIIEDRKKVADKLNHILSQFGDDIIARMGVPCAERTKSVITLVVDTDTDKLGALTGKLGALEGVTVKSGLAS